MNYYFYLSYFNLQKKHIKIVCCIKPSKSDLDNTIVKWWCKIEWL